MINSHFTTVRRGTVIPLSLVITGARFSFKHHLWLAGMMAGVAFNLLLYKTLYSRAL